jgi:ribosomal-protein-alanine N-acetyltransferase
MTVTYRTNAATIDQLSDHLQRCDDGYVPALSGRVDIAEYARKVAERATRFEAWSDDGLVGLVAAYLPTASNGPMFITDVSVAPEHRGNGVASALLDECAGYARLHSIVRLRLEVDPRNGPALGLYKASGFASVAEVAGTVTMERPVNDAGRER